MLKMVEAKVIDKDGRIIKRIAVNEEEFNEYVEKMKKKNNNDLTTLWFLRFLVALFTPVDLAANSSFTFTDTGGTSRTQVVKGNFGANNGFLNTTYCLNKPYIGVGTSSTSPTRSDYRLGNKVAEAVASIYSDENIFVITLTAGFVFSSDTVIYEVGLEWLGTISGSSTCGRFLVDRTVFPDGISVPAGQTLAITYKFTL
jgi:hypothetical protein